MTSSLLASHFAQMAVCASSIASLPFPGPKSFTNALLAPHDITALIRDTEAHERALFSIAPPPVPNKSQIHQFSSSLSAPLQSSQQSRPVLNPSSTRQPRRHTAVAAVLGGDLYRRTRNGLDPDSTNRYARPPARDRSNVDVELLLEGAEKLCAVYPVPGASDRIAQLRNRYSQLAANIAHYEDRVASQATQMDRMYQPVDDDNHDYEDNDDDDHVMIHDDAEATVHTIRMTREDLRQEEEEIRALEQKKRALEERVTGMEKDIGGLMR